MSKLMPLAMSQESGMPFALQSLAKVDAISHESGMPLRLQSLAMPLAMSHESGTRLLLQSGTAPCATAQTSNRRSPSQSPEVGLIPTYEMPIVVWPTPLHSVGSTVAGQETDTVNDPVDPMSAANCSRVRSITARSGVAGQSFPPASKNLRGKSPLSETSIHSLTVFKSPLTSIVN